jgi:aminocarboxymuconate-semialdehyde decarboxylase
MANDGLAELCRLHPQRFPTFIASLPMNDIDASLQEIDRAVNVLDAKGIQVFTNVAGKPLSAPEFRPVFARMVEHGLPVWVHPMRGPQFSDYTTEKMSEDEIWFTFGWPYETTACMTRLIYSGLLDEMPKLKIITHHMGGMIPYFAGRIALGFKQIFFGEPDRNPGAEKLKKPPRDYFKMFYADTALNGDIAATRCGHDYFGTARCLFATDAPFDAEQGKGLIAKTISAVEALDIGKDAQQRIFSGNARGLLRL